MIDNSFINEFDLQVSFLILELTSHCPNEKDSIQYLTFFTVTESLYRTAIISFLLMSDLHAEQLSRPTSWHKFVVSY